MGQRRHAFHIANASAATEAFPSFRCHPPMWATKAKAWVPRQQPMARVLITGGGGYIGQACARAFNGEGWQVHVLDRRSSDECEGMDALLAEGCTFHHADILDEVAVAEAMAKCDAVLHLAAVSSVPDSISDPTTTMRVNVDGTDTVLRVAARLGVQRVIAASSAAVYGSNPNMPLEETATLQPLSPYAESKRLNEQAVNAYRDSGMDAIAVRFFNVYGGDQVRFANNRSVVPSFLRTMIAGEAPCMFGDGSQTRDFIHVDDLARALVALMGLEGPFQHATVNLCTQREHSMLDVMNGINEALVRRGVLDKALVPTHQPPREGDIHRSYGSNRRLVETTGWTPKYGFADGLDDTVGRFLGGARE